MAAGKEGELFVQADSESFPPLPRQKLETFSSSAAVVCPKMLFCCQKLFHSGPEGDAGSGDGGGAVASKPENGLKFADLLLHTTFVLQ